jgi:hypothetical protein
VGGFQGKLGWEGRVCRNLLSLQTVDLTLNFDGTWVCMCLKTAVSTSKLEMVLLTLKLLSETFEESQNRLVLCLFVVCSIVEDLQRDKKNLMESTDWIFLFV